MRSLLAAVLATALIQTGCFIVDKPCNPEDVPQEPGNGGLRNPDTGLCEFAGGGGGGTCDDFGVPGGAADVAILDWGLCFSECTGLDEASCVATPGCRAAYVSSCPEGADCPAISYSFAECWQVAPSGPVQGGDCSTLGSQECSRHDDCVARHYPSGAAGAPGPQPRVPIALPVVGRFESCAAEQSSPPLQTCFGQPLCESLPPDCPVNTVPGVINTCWSGDCIPVDQCEPAPSCAIVPTEAACVAQVKCAPIYAGRDCSCDAAGVCTCQTLAYNGCQDS